MSESNPKEDGNTIQVRIAFNMRTNTLTLTSMAPAVLLLGILEQAKATVIEKQIEVHFESKRQGLVAPTTPEVVGAQASKGS